MSAARLRGGLVLLTVLCFCVCTTVCSNVVWRDTGESITIQCRTNSSGDALSMSVKKGQSRDMDIFFQSAGSSHMTFAYKDRSQENGDFPNKSILIKNLTKSDTGVYWCLYKKITHVNRFPELVEEVGIGSILLVVTDPVVKDDKSRAAVRPCVPPNQNLVVISVAISAAVLLLIFITMVLLVVRKVKYMRIENKPRPAPHNDVYEDMRGTIRR